MWELRWPAGKDPLTGRRVTKSQRFRGTSKEAWKKVAGLASEHTGTESKLTLDDAIRRWRADTKHANATARNYDFAAAKIPAHLKAMEAGKIRAAHLRPLFAAIEAEHGVHRSRLVQSVVAGALSWAHQHELIRSNPARLVRYASVGRRKRTDPTPAEVRALVAALSDDVQMTVWVVLHSVLGARRSEVLALRWSHIDLGHYLDLEDGTIANVGQITIEQALDPITGVEKDVKTAGKGMDRRTIPIDASTVLLLKHWRNITADRARQAGVVLVDDPFLLPAVDSRVGRERVSLDGAEPWRPDIATKRFARYRKAAKISDEIRLTDLRHYVATHLLGAGHDPRSVAATMGHTRVATTTDLYGHAIPSHQRAHADTLGGLLRGEGAA